MHEKIIPVKSLGYSGGLDAADFKAIAPAPEDLSGVGVEGDTGDEGDVSFLPAEEEPAPSAPLSPEEQAAEDKARGASTNRRY